MIKTFISLIVTLAVVLTGGIIEQIGLGSQYKHFHNELVDALIAAENDNLDSVHFENLYNDWCKLKERSEFWVNHNDTNEMNMRMCECMSYVQNNDMEQAHMQLMVMVFFSEYIPEALHPRLENIF